MNIILKTDDKILLQVRKLYTNDHIINEIWKFLATDLVYLIPVFLVIVWFAHTKARAASIRGAVVGFFGWQVLTRLIAMVWYRPRPVDSGLGLKELVFHRPTYSFPSDHALFAFAVAAAFYFAGHKKIGIALYIVAFIISVSRVVVGVHFPLDVIVGGLLGVLMSWLAWHYRGYFDPIVVAPITKIMQWLHLA